MADINRLRNTFDGRDYDLHSNTLSATSVSAEQLNVGYLDSMVRSSRPDPQTLSTKELTIVPRVIHPGTGEPNITITKETIARWKNKSYMRGEKGLLGDRGLPGPEGVRGPRGIPGMRGPTGNQGPKGPDGVAGPPGVDGDPGEDGPIGDPGLKGNTGVRGPRGTKGTPGTVTPYEFPEGRNSIPYWASAENMVFTIMPPGSSLSFPPTTTGLPYVRAFTGLDPVPTHSGFGMYVANTAIQIPRRGFSVCPIFLNTGNLTTKPFFDCQHYFGVSPLPDYSLKFNITVKLVYCGPSTNTYWDIWAIVLTHLGQNEVVTLAGMDALLFIPFLEKIHEYPYDPTEYMYD